MSLLPWLAPSLITAALLVPLAFALSAVRDETARLRRSVRSVGELRPAVVEVEDELAALRRRLETLRSR